MIKSKLIKYSSFIILGVLWGGQGIGMEKPVTKEYKFDNGLKLVVREDHRAPVVVSQIWYKVGASNEYRPITGISHALEHMMFKGTPTIPQDGFSRLISGLGGRENAFTGDDYTAYYEELDASHLETSFKLEADRMTHLNLAASDFEKELQVVIEERRLRTDDNPFELTHERFMAVANVIGPYHHPIIGWREDIDKLNVNALRQWYEQWYAPNNATIVVVGDVKADDVAKLARQYFGDLSPKTLPAPLPSRDLKPLGEKRIKVEIPAKLPYLLMGYDVPTLTTTDNPQEIFALILACGLLDQGNSARFAKTLVRGSQIAAQASCMYDPFKKYETQFFLSGVPSEGHTVKQLEAAFLVEIDQLKTQPISPEELERVKNQWLAHEVFERDSMSEQATLLGLLETVGLHWELSDELMGHIKAVTAEQIQLLLRNILYLPL